MATGVGRRAWIVAAEASGSRAQAVSRSKHQKKPLESGGFSFLLPVPMAGEYPAGLLDIGGGLC
jgi:hypothetical protein